MSEQLLSEEQTQENILALLGKVPVLSEQEETEWQIDFSRDSIRYRAVFQDFGLLITASKQMVRESRFKTLSEFYTKITTEEKCCWPETIHPDYELIIRFSFTKKTKVTRWRFNHRSSLIVEFPCYSWSLKRESYGPEQDQAAIKLIDRIICVAEEKANESKIEQGKKGAMKMQTYLEAIIQKI